MEKLFFSHNGLEVHVEMPISYGESKKIAQITDLGLVLLGGIPVNLIKRLARSSIELFCFAFD